MIDLNGYSELSEVGLYLRLTLVLKFSLQRYKLPNFTEILGFCYVIPFLGPGWFVEYNPFLSSFNMVVCGFCCFCLTVDKNVCMLQD